MSQLTRLAISLLFLLLPLIVLAEEIVTITHYQYHERYAFGGKVLKLAMSKTDKPFVVVTPNGQSVNEARGERLVIAGDLDIQWLSTSREREEKMIAIKIPVYRGILGLRLFLVEKSKHSAISSITSIEELRGFTGGHGSHWSDLSVYPANQLPVVTNTNYDALFEQLKRGRFDYFHRGINEIWQELDRHQEHLSVADNIMLFYPHPVYFFVSKNNPELAQNIEKGLRIALEDGSFKALFLEEHNEIIEKANLKSRKLIVLNNSVNPGETPNIDTSWWLPQSLN